MFSISKSAAGLAALLIAIVPGEPAKAQATVAVPASYKNYAVSTPAPTYPFEARMDDLEGSGIARLTIDRQSGKAISATMQRSTGHKILDEAALRAVRQWQFKSGTPFHVIKIPVDFALKRRGPTARKLRREQPKRSAVCAAVPKYPAEARKKRMTGAGVALLDVDPRTGAVTDARMIVSTGHAILDDAAVTAFRQWHFKRGTKQVRVPIEYTMAGAKY